MAIYFSVPLSLLIIGEERVDASFRKKEGDIRPSLIVDLSYGFPQGIFIFRESGIRIY